MLDASHHDKCDDFMSLDHHVIHYEKNRGIFRLDFIRFKIFVLMLGFIIHFFYNIKIMKPPNI